MHPYIYPCHRKKEGKKSKKNPNPKLLETASK
jgi:hypothetical protein